MQNGLIELILQALLFLSYTVVGTAVAGLGVFFEYRSYTVFSTGDLFVAAWLAALGLIMFGFAYLVVSDKATAAYAELQRQRAGRTE